MSLSFPLSSLFANVWFLAFFEKICLCDLHFLGLLGTTRKGSVVTPLVKTQICWPFPVPPDLWVLGQTHVESVPKSLQAAAPPVAEICGAIALLGKGDRWLKTCGQEQRSDTAVLLAASSRSLTLEELHFLTK